MTDIRRIVTFNRVSADGYFSAGDGNLDWTVPDEEIDKAAAEEIDKSSSEKTAGTDTVIFGRRTYEMFASFWPHVLDESTTAPDPHGSGRRSPELRAMAVWLNNATKLVFSKTLEEATWKNSRLFQELDPREIEALKKQPGRDMIIFGSGSIVSQLAQHGLVDEYRFVVTPILLGDGMPLVSRVTKRSKLKLLEAKGYRSGNVMLRYVPLPE